MDKESVDFSEQCYFHSADFLGDNEVISITLSYHHLHVITGVYSLSGTHIHTHHYWIHTLNRRHTTDASFHLYTHTTLHTGIHAPRFLPSQYMS